MRSVNPHLLSADEMNSKAPSIFNTARVIDQMLTWDGIELSRNEKREYAKKAYALRHKDDKVENVEYMICPKRQQDVGNSLYKTYNIVQERMIKGGLRVSKINENGIIKNVSLRGINAIGPNLEFNRDLWQLTNEITQLKAA
jgi:hypothetical protein